MALRFASVARSDNHAQSFFNFAHPNDNLLKSLPRDQVRSAKPEMSRTIQGRSPTFHPPQCPPQIQGWQKLKNRRPVQLSPKTAPPDPARCRICAPFLVFITFWDFIIRRPEQRHFRAAIHEKGWKNAPTVVRALVPINWKGGKK